MKRVSPSIVLGCVLLVSLMLTAWASSLFASPLETASPDGIWNHVQEREIQLQGERLIVPDVYRVVAADVAGLRKLLAAAPLAATTEAERRATLLSLPLPNGDWSRFRIEQAPIMEPGLARQFPDITTYRGVSIDDHGVTARLDWTLAGFHGVIYAADDLIFIDPYSRNDTVHYISYSRNAYMTAARRADHGIEQVAPLDAGSLAAPNLNEPLRVGETLRTYRLAVAATGEYTQFHGGTVAAAQAAIVTTINRVVGIYEKEIAVRLVLINNNQNIIYTNGNTDPYSNEDGTAMLDENQATIDNVIGTANYDVGHVFSTGGGGIAALGSPCDSSVKAQGVTGSPQPTGDPFDVDYVAHELGHQFGANHTYNSESGSCGGNRNGPTAYEPGSGTTIMAYAGICAPENIQDNSDPYFHYASIAEISAFVSGAGDACAQKTTTGNTPPVAEAGPNYTIPANTPFQLSGSGSDVDGGQLRYTWEEYDLGSASPPITDDGSQPLFRSFSPSASPVRILPQLSSILNGTSTMGEMLPTTNRTMTFRLTVRDNNTTAGGIGSDTMQVTVNANQGPFRVTAPDTAVTWSGGSQQTVTWDVANTTAAPVSCANVDILLSTNGGATFTALVTAVTNDGSQQISVPNTPTATARIKVACSNNIFFDISNANFTIQAGTGATSTPVTPTSTAVVPTATSTAVVPTATSTAVVPTATSTAVVPTVTSTPVIGSCPTGQTENVLFFDDVETLNEYWTVTNTLGLITWAVTDSVAYSPDESWHGPNLDETSDLRLTMNDPVGISGTASSATMSFWHDYSFEQASVGTLYDGGVLEYSTDGGSTWQDTASLFTSNGYDGAISSIFSNPLAGRQGFGGSSGGFIQSELDLASLIGQNVQFRFRIGTDSSGDAEGWYVDDIRITSCSVGGTGTPTTTAVPPTSTPSTPTSTAVTPTSTAVTPTTTAVTPTSTPSTPTSTVVTPTTTAVTPTATPDFEDEYVIFLPYVAR